jgi:hypothetical protein
MESMKKHNRTAARHTSTAAIAEPMERRMLMSVVPITGTPIGTAGSYLNDGDTIANAFDGNLNTYFDGPANSGDTVGLDFGAAKTVTEIAYAPRSGFASRMFGGVFQGANSADFSGAVNLYQITSTPAVGSLTTVALTAAVQYRYVRYVAPGGSFGNVAELDFYGPAAGAPIVGAVGGTAGSYQNDGNTVAKAFDGNLGTFFDGPTASGDVVVDNFGKPYSISSIEYAPRGGFSGRMAGGVFQASNSSSFSTYTVLSVIYTTPSSGYTTVTPLSATPFQYVRYVAPTNSYGDVAEIAYFGTAAGSVTVGDDGFESPGLGQNTYQYDPTGTAWTYSTQYSDTDYGGTGVAENGGDFDVEGATNGNSDGTTSLAGQAAFIQKGDGSIGQMKSATIDQAVQLAAGSYTLSFADEARDDGVDGDPFTAEIFDPTLANSYFSQTLTPTMLSTFTPFSGTFTVPAAGTYYLYFVGDGSNNQDVTSFVDNVQITSGPTKLAGTPIGTAGSYANSGNTIANVFDGNLVTYFDAPTASGCWVGLDLGTAKLRIPHAGRVVPGQQHRRFLIGRGHAGDDHNRPKAGRADHAVAEQHHRLSLLPLHRPW